MLQTWNNSRTSESFCKTLLTRMRISYCSGRWKTRAHSLCCKYLNIGLKNMTKMRTSTARIVSSRSTE